MTWELSETDEPHELFLDVQNELGGSIYYEILEDDGNHRIEDFEFPPGKYTAHLGRKVTVPGRCLQWGDSIAQCCNSSTMITISSATATQL